MEILPKYTFIIGVLIVAIAARGEWLLFMVYLWRDYFQALVDPATPASSNVTHVQEPTTPHRFKNLHLFVIMAVSISFVSFWGIGFFFDKYFYKDRKTVSEEWKCQPNRWLTRENEWHEFCLGSFNMLLGSVGSGILACYIANGGYTSLYFGIGDYGYIWFLVSIPVMYLYNDTSFYYYHRCLHLPYVYRKLHWMHHRYGSPTLYGATAMHPLELIMYQIILFIPVFTMPMHVGIYLLNNIYGYYYGMMDHSGIKMAAIWPWQPSSMFHDNHHRYVNCNYGFNSTMLDRMHGTLRKKAS